MIKVNEDYSKETLEFVNGHEFLKLYVACCEDNRIESIITECDHEEDVYLNFHAIGKDKRDESISAVVSFADKNIIKKTTAYFFVICCYEGGVSIDFFTTKDTAVLALYRMGVEVKES